MLNILLVGSGGKKFRFYSLSFYRRWRYAVVLVITPTGLVDIHYNSGWTYSVFTTQKTTDNLDVNFLLFHFHQFNKLVDEARAQSFISFKYTNLHVYARNNVCRTSQYVVYDSSTSVTQPDKIVNSAKQTTSALYTTSISIILLL